MLNINTPQILCAILCTLSWSYAQQLPPAILAQQQGQQQQGGVMGGQQSSASMMGGQQTGTQAQLTLNPSQVNPASGTTGNEGGGKQSTPSAQSTNNFINFCEGQALTNGLLNEKATCNPIPLGSVPAKDKMPSIRIMSPSNLQKFEPNQPFEIRMSARNFITGSATATAKTYFSAPQQLDQNGNVLGHLHLIIDRIDRNLQQAPDISGKPVFYKSVTEKGDGQGMSTVKVDGFPDGEYRISTVASSSNHVSVALPVAERGSMDDSIYVFIGGAASILDEAARASPRPGGQPRRQKRNHLNLMKRTPWTNN